MYICALEVAVLVEEYPGKSLIATALTTLTDLLLPEILLKFDIARISILKTTHQDLTTM